MKPVTLSAATSSPSELSKILKLLSLLAEIGVPVALSLVHNPATQTDIQLGGEVLSTVAAATA